MGDDAAQTDAQAAAASAITLMCKKLNGAAEVLPQKLSQSATNEINRACADFKGKVADKLGDAARPTRDLENVARGSLDKISKETWKELAQIAAKLGAQSTTANPNASTGQPSFNPDTYTGGTGEQRSLLIPTKWSSGLDIHLLINTNSNAEILKSGTLQIFGAGAAATYQEKNFSTDIRIFVDTSAAKPAAGGSVMLKIEF